MSEKFSFRCASCSQVHAGTPDLAYDAPLHYYQIPESERSKRCVLTSDTCVIDGEDRFVRACLEIPIRGHSEVFVWGVWVSLSERSFDRYEELYESTERVEEGPFFGWLCNRLPGYPD